MVLSNCIFIICVRLEIRKVLSGDGSNRNVEGGGKEVKSSAISSIVVTKGRRGFIFKKLNIGVINYNVY